MTKIHWQCRRGLLELDLILNRFLNQNYLDLNESERAQFEQLLAYPDSDLYAWLIGAEIVSDLSLSNLVAKIRATCGVENTF
jgi:antitoxin CptB